MQGGSSGGYPSDVLVLEGQRVMTKDRRDVKLTIGDWIISSGPKKNAHFMYHRCSGGRAAIAVFTGLSRCGGRLKPHWYCWRCDKPPPEGLVGVYLLLESEYAYEIMGRVMKGAGND
jgi:hypothetical protein